MARGFYRFYLYMFSNALLIFAAVATTLLLSALFSLTPLRGAYSSPPSQAALVQAWVFALVSWLIAGILGGLHYWLIRRDMRNDPAARISAVRSFFLNIIQALGMLLAVAFIGFGIIDPWAHASGANLALSAAIGLTSLVIVTLLELERRRTPLQKGAALVFQRVNFFGVQLILLFFLTAAFLNDLSYLVDGLFFSKDLCNPYGCPSYNLLGLGLAVLWFTGCWLIYALVTSKDSSRTTRLVLHGAGLAFGVGYILYSVYSALETLMQVSFHIALEGENTIALYAFIAPLLLGLLVTAIYHVLVYDVSRRGLVEVQMRALIEWVIAGLLLAGAFWWGMSDIVYNLLQGQPASDSLLWVNALALLITGVSYIPLDLYLRQCYRLDPVYGTGPRRAFVLALLGAGLLALAIGGARALYAWGTALLGSPISGWPQVVHNGLATAIIGVVVASIYLWTARGEQLFARHTRTGQPLMPALPATPVSPTTVEEILDELLVGHINREEAAARLRKLENVAITVPADNAP